MPDFNENLPEWNEAGLEPNQTRKDSGFAPSDKPPAQWLNWIFNRTFKSMLELRTAFKERISAITGNADWWTAPTMTIQSIFERFQRTPEQTKADLTYYVRTDGNDNNDGLANTAGGAFKTIGKAVTAIPQVVNHTVTINVAGGTYAENVLVRGFDGTGSISILAATAAGDTHTINWFEASANTIMVILRGFRVSTATKEAFLVSGVSTVLLDACKVDAATTVYNGVYALLGASVRVYNCLISNRNSGVYASYDAGVWVSGTTGTGNQKGLYADRGGRIVREGSTITGIKHEDALVGGIVTTAGIINPWGDNTLAARSYVYATMGAVAPVASGVWTKLPFSVETADNLAEFDTALNRFTAKHTGLYLVAYAVRFDAIAAGFECVLGIYVNAGRAWSRSSFSVAPGTILDMQMIREVRLNVGDYIEPYAYQNTGATKNVVNSADVTNLVISQIA